MVSIFTPFLPAPVQCLGRWRGVGVLRTVLFGPLFFLVRDLSCGTGLDPTPRLAGHPGSDPLSILKSNPSCPRLDLTAGHRVEFRSWRPRASRRDLLSPGND